MTNRAGSSQRSIHDSMLTSVGYAQPGGGSHPSSTPVAPNMDRPSGVPDDVREHVTRGRTAAEPEAEVWSKVPAVTVALWLVKIFATTVGETGGGPRASVVAPDDPLTYHHPVLQNRTTAPDRLSVRRATTQRHPLRPRSPSDGLIGCLRTVSFEGKPARQRLPSPNGPEYRPPLHRLDPRRRR